MFANVCLSFRCSLFWELVVIAIDFFLTYDDGYGRTVYSCIFVSEITK